jgi:sugar phosphate isomerase/epimerase
MPRTITLFTGQWADLPLETICARAASWGYDGLELACWGDHFDVAQAKDSDAYCRAKWAMLADHKLTCRAISNHLVGQAVCDRIDERHKAIVPERVWGEGDPEGVRRRAAQEMIDTARAARRFFDCASQHSAPGSRHETAADSPRVVNGFTGSSIWPLIYPFPPLAPGMIDAGFADFAMRWKPILDAFAQVNVRFALEVHPAEIAFDIASARRALKAIAHHPSFGFNFDPSHFAYQGVDHIAFIREFGPQILHCHIKDVWWSERPTEAGVFGGHTEFGDASRCWDFRSPGRGRIDFESVIRALNHAGYSGPLSVEWEDPMMDREHGAREAAEFVRKLDFALSQQAFDAAFAR